MPLLLQTANGNVEAKVVCFYRRRDISSALIALADKHASESRPRVGGPAFPSPPQARSPASEATCTTCSAPPPPLLHLWPRVRGAQARWGFMDPGVCLSPQGIGGTICLRGFSMRSILRPQISWTVSWVLPGGWGCGLLVLPTLAPVLCQEVSTVAPTVLSR